MLNNKDRFNIAYESKSKDCSIAKLAQKFNTTRGKVESSIHYFDSDYKDNEHIRHQMLLGSKLGDGYFQKINRTTVLYKYRESHSIQELEYAKWKYLMLGEYNKRVHICSKNKGEAVELYSNAKASDFMKYYYDLSIEEVIEQIDIYGLLIWLLDGGWYNTHSKRGNFNITSLLLTPEQKELLIKKFAQYSITVNLIGKDLDFSFSSDDNFILLAYLQKMMFTLDLDVINKKIWKYYKTIYYYCIVYSLSCMR